MMRGYRKALVVLSLAVLPGWAGAQERPRLDEPVQPHPEGEAAIDRLLSPYCPGFMLEVCPSPQAKLLRDSIQEMAHQGVSADSLVSWMLATHGDQYLAVPRASGSGLWAWIMPPLALVAGVLVVVLALRQFRARAAAAESTRPKERALSPEEESELAAALEELKTSEEVPF